MLSRAFFGFLLVLLVWSSSIAYGVSISSDMDRFIDYYRRFYGVDEYIVYRGMLLNLSDSFSMEVVVKNETGYDVQEPLVNASIIVDNAFKVVNKNLRVVYENFSRSDNSTIVRVHAWLSGSIVVKEDAPLDTLHRIGVEWIVTRYINTTLLGTNLVVKREYRYTHLLGYPIRVIPRNVTGNYTVGDNLLSWAYPTPLGINITLFNPALGIPGPENETYWGVMLPLRPTMFIVYNVSVDITITSNDKLLYSDGIYVGELVANETLTIPVVLFNSSLWNIPSRLLNVSLRIKCVDDIHGVLVLNRSYLVYYNYTWVNILYAPSTVYIYDGDTGELVEAVEGPWPKRVYLAPFRYYVFKCVGCRDLGLWVIDPVNITLYEEQWIGTVTPWTPIPRADPWSMVRYIVALLVILFTIVLLIEKMVREASF